MQWAVLGTNDLNASNQLKVYPTPATSYVTIDNGNAPVQSIEIYNIVGEKIYFTENENLKWSKEIKLDVSDWIPVIYIYIVHSGSNTIQGKFSVQH